MLFFYVYLYIYTYVYVYVYVYIYYIYMFFSGLDPVDLLERENPLSNLENPNFNSVFSHILSLSSAIERSIPHCGGAFRGRERGGGVIKPM